MYLLALLAAIALFAWAIVVLVRGSVFLSTALFLVATSVFPAEFFAIDAAGLTWTLDRLWFVILLAQAGLSWYRGELKIGQLEFPDLAIGFFAIWLIIRAATQPLGSVLPGQPSTLMHLINGYLIPFGLYAVLRTTRLDIKQLSPALVIVICTGGYLSITAFLEVLKIWPLVFPSFIGDSTIGIHFGRARGPMLQSVRLGMCLVAVWLLLVTYTVWLKPTCKTRWIIFGAGSLLLFGAVFVTYTRSVWLGLAFSIGMLTLMGLQGKMRRVAITSLLMAGAVVGLIKGPDLIAFKREFSAAETKESTYMRAAFAYVSIEMFKDKPVFGHGFNQFQVYNRPYLDDRTTEIRLNSIRGYVHHNGFLSLLVDLGIIGFSAYLFVCLTIVFTSLNLWRAQSVPKWARGFAMVTLSFLGVHAIQMAFHEVSFTSIENGILFTFVGLTAAAHQQYCVRPTRRGWRTEGSLFKNRRLANQTT